MRRRAPGRTPGPRTRSSGVQAGQAVHLDGEPGDRARRAPVADQRRRPAPCARSPPTAASNASDTLGMRMYSVSVGRMSSSQPASIVRRSACRSASSPSPCAAARRQRALGLGHHRATSSPAGTSPSMAPTPCPHGMNSRRRSTVGAVGVAEVVDAGPGRGDGLGRERLQLVGVLLEVLRPVVAHDAARLAGERPADDGAVLGRGRAASPCSRRPRGPRAWR